MVLNKYIHVELKKSLIIFVIIAIVYNSGYLVMTTKSSIALPLLIFATFILLYKLLLKGVIPNIRYFHFKIFYLLFTLIIINFMFNMSIAAINIYLHYILILTFSVFLVSIISYEDFIDYFIKTMKLIAIISLVMFSLIEIFGYNFQFNLIRNTNGRIFYDAKVFFYPQYFSTFRNQGLFWEPGLFASFLIIALIFELFLIKRVPKISNVLIFLLTLISTKSSAGYALLFLLLLAFLFKNKKSGNASLISIFGVTIYILSVLNLDTLIKKLYSFSPDIFGKFLVNYGEVSSRFIAPRINLLIFMENPLFGVGFNEATKRFIDFGRMVGVDSQTSTSTFYLAALGLLGISFTLLWIYSIINIKGQNIFVRVIILTIILLILNKEPHSSLLVTNCILFNFLRRDVIKIDNSQSLR